ncbi:hypothetical protein Bbelb_084440 [Branchiostoma belcheri]|nr:hypothetical protein Bbelb_084440 [Branchiostoma belcheri]
MAAGNTKVSLEDNTTGKCGDFKTDSLHCPSAVPNEYTPAPKRGISKEKEWVTITRPKHGYKNTFTGKKTTCPNDTKTVIMEPATAELRYLHVDDHVVVYSKHGSEEDTNGENVNMGHGEYSTSSDYENPEDVHVYKENVSTGQNKHSASGDYENPEDVHVHKENVSTGQVEHPPFGNYENPEDVHVYKENVNIGQNEHSPFGNYENPEDVHVHKENVSTGQVEHPPFGNYENPEDVHVYKENVNIGQNEHSPPGDYENPEDVHVYKWPENAGTEQNKDTPSDDYENPEDVHVYTEPENAGRGQNEDSPFDDNENPEDPENLSFVFKTKARLLDLWHKAMSRKLFRLALGCGILAIMLAILVSCLIPDREVVMKSGTTNNMAASDPSPQSPPRANTSLDAKPLSTTVTSMSTTDMNKCAENPCQHGTCENIDSGYYCFCQPGWTGQNCQQDLNECAKSPCGHGICLNNDGAYSCACSHGWTGQKCLQDFNECTTPPCQHGHCENYPGGYRCTCSAGWTGKNCQQDFNECTTNPCQRGSCVNKDGGYDCNCQHGWTGTNCQQAIPCQSGWSEYKNNCYKLFKDKVDWSTASGRCKQHGANLASVGSAGENNFIAHLISDAPKGYKRYLVWFGLNLGVDEQWKWTDGSRVSYTNWAPNEPGRNFFGRKVKCANMYSKGDDAWFLGAKGNKGEWNDHSCRAKLPYVCKTAK